MSRGVAAEKSARRHGGTDVPELGITLSAGHFRMDLLLCGETGTGKDVLARHIHDLSGRTGAFVGINCAAIPEALAESQLFGVASGAFTGANRSRQGYIEASNDGTLYLDEIDSMPLQLQAKLLRVLETRGVERLGTTRFIPLNLRIIASTQRPLEELVEQGLFRRDLLFRLNAMTLSLPPLRQRRELILPLFKRFTRSLGAKQANGAHALDSQLIQILLSHPWPGNIRELKSAAKRFVIGLPPIDVGTLDDLEDSDFPHDRRGLKKRMRAVEKMLIQDALKRHKNGLEAVAEELGISRRTLYQRIKELDV